MVQHRQYSPEMQGVWDGFVNESAWNGTFLHTRQFLSYHGDRFEDASVVVNDEEGQTLAVFPAAAHPVAKDTVVSHPGATFGGLVAGGQCRGERCISVLKAVMEYYRGRGFKRLLYKAVPLIYHQVPFQDDLYSLFRLGFRRVRCDISATIAANDRRTLTACRKRGISKAKKRGVEIVEGLAHLGDIHALIEANLWQAHQVKPVHSLSELRLLQSRFPENVKCWAARLDSEVVAGVVMFNFKTVAHTQYIASNEQGRAVGALDLLLESSIHAAFVETYRYFDFGNSNEQEGRILNEGLYRHKRGFGAGSVVHEFYELEL